MFSGEITGGDKMNTARRYSLTICAHGENWLYVVVGLRTRADRTNLKGMGTDPSLQGDEVESFAQISVKIRGAPGANQDHSSA